MFSEYIAASLGRAEYEVIDIDNPEPYYAHPLGSLEAQPAVVNEI